MTTQLPLLDDLIADKYRLHEVIGEGGFGRVYRASTVGTEREVAIKVLKPGNDGYDVKRAARFFRELRAIAKLEEPTTVTLYDHGKTDDGLLYMVCEYVEGQDLEEVLRQRGRLSDGEVVHILRQVLRSLIEAHELDILHRDLKPANIRIHSYGDDPLRVKVLDFGLAKSLARNETPLTAQGKAVGTPRYMAPEQLFGRKLTPATDIFSLGLVAYEALQGPSSTIAYGFTAKTEPLKLAKRDGVDRALRRVVNRMLRPEPEQRFPTARAVLVALRALPHSIPQTPAASDPERTPTIRIGPTDADPTDVDVDVDITDTQLDAEVLAETQDELPTRRASRKRPPSAAHSGPVSWARAALISTVLAALALMVVIHWTRPDDEPVSRSGVRILPKPGAKQTRARDLRASEGCGRNAQAPGSFILRGTGPTTRKSGGQPEAYLPMSYSPDDPVPLVLVDGARRVLSADWVEAAEDHALALLTTARPDWRDRMRRRVCIDRTAEFVVALGDDAHAQCDEATRAVASTQSVGGYFPCDRTVPRLHIRWDDHSDASALQRWKTQNRCSEGPTPWGNFAQMECSAFACETPLVVCQTSEFTPGAQFPFVMLRFFDEVRSAAPLKRSDERPRPGD